ncbi:hypothetical protein EDB19DRAFT_1910538 [Suillus lakei]|nr:hypothetical protein EDB19DRAFT_1910538 [Suillus lakei]
MASKATRLRALALYKELHRLGRDYEPSYDFHGKLRRNRNLANEEEIEKALRLGEYIKNGKSRCFTNSLPQLIKRARNPCLVLAPQVSILETDVSFKLYVRYLTILDRSHSDRTPLQSAAFPLFHDSGRWKKESGRIVELYEARAYDKVDIFAQKLSLFAASAASSLSGVISLKQLYS